MSRSPLPASSANRSSSSEAAWCELRQEFRNFRLDRVAASTMGDETFEDEAGKALRDMLARYGPEAVRLIDS